jgi:lipopolysaccharide transport system permease protein
MVGVIEGFRWAIFGGIRPDLSIALSFAVTAVVLVGGIAYFRRVERTFADTI